MFGKLVPKNPLAKVPAFLEMAGYKKCLRARAKESLANPVC
jgi:hypothetical protein